jgi:peptide/nickel transport system substrate-binding protein
VKHKNNPGFVPIILTICILVLLLIPACASATPSSKLPTAVPSPAPAGPQTGGILKIAEQVEGMNIGYPVKQGPLGSWKQVAPAVEKLFRYDDKGSIVPLLAEGSKSDADAKTIIISLKKGIKFHDGTDFNAQAVKWNLDTCQAGKVVGTEKYKSVDVVDDYTVRINLTQWDSTVLSSLAYIAGQIISPASVQKNGVDWACGNPVGTGPFKFVSWQKDVKTVYTKFSDYWQKGKPYLDGVEYSIIVDANTRAISVKAADTDVVLTMPLPADPTDFEKSGCTVLHRPDSGGALSLVFNSVAADSPFANLKVRQAVSYAINRKAIAKGLLLDENLDVNQYDIKSSWGYNPAVAGYPYNPDKAKQLLAEAGYANGLKTKLTYQINPAFETIYQAAQEQLRTVGITCEMVPTAPPKFREVIGQTGAPALGWDGILAASPRVNPDITLVLGQAFGTKSMAREFGSRMVIPDDMDQAYQNAITAPDLAGKQKWTQEWQKLAVDKYCLFCGIVSPPSFVITQSYVKDSGWLDSAFLAQWTPENAWINKKK